MPIKYDDQFFWIEGGLAEMVGGPGKVKIDAKVYLVLQDGKKEVDGAVAYIHVKGHMGARVTHIDIERRVLGKIIHRGRATCWK